VNFIWVKGHNGHPENERCDQLATKALTSSNLIEDTGYELESPEQSLSFLDNPEPLMINGKPAGSLSIKVKEVGDPCRFCGSAVIRQEPAPDRQKRPSQEYYFEYYLYCNSCKKMFMVEEAKRLF